MKPWLLMSLLCPALAERSLEIFTPLWAGYTVGYRLVAKRLAEGGESDWRVISAMPASAFLPAAKGSGN